MAATATAYSHNVLRLQWAGGGRLEDIEGISTMLLVDSKRGGVANIQVCKITVEVETDIKYHSSMDWLLLAISLVVHQGDFHPPSRDVQPSRVGLFLPARGYSCWRIHYTVCYANSRPNISLPALILRCLLPLAAI